MTEQDRAYWDKGSQIFYCDGKGYGVSPQLNTICLGDEDDIKKALDNNLSMDNPIINKILQQEIGECGKAKSATTTPPKRTVRHFWRRKKVR